MERWYCLIISSIPFVPWRKPKDGSDLFLKFKSELILSPCAKEMEFIADGPEELEALIQNPRLVGKEDRVPTVRLIFCPDDPSTDLEVS